MHGRKKRVEPFSQDEINALEKKTNAYKGLLIKLLENKNAGDLSPMSLELTGKLLRSNPDVGTLWNYRREILLSHTPELAKMMDGSAILGHMKLRKDEIRDQELTLSIDGIMKNSKSYGAWDHRRWVLERFCCNFESEFALCQKFLVYDERNFHCWNFRRFLVQLQCRQESEASASAPSDSSSTSTKVHVEPRLSALMVQRELDFSMEKISENFSNYSAYHHRSIYLRDYTSGAERIAIFEQECEMVGSALFTEPDDQSAWWYFQFLITWSKDGILSPTSSATAFDIAHYKELLMEQAEQLKVLCEEDNDYKWPKVSLAFLLKHVANTPSGDEDADHTASQDQCDQRLDLLVELQRKDTDHANHYAYLVR